MGCFTLTVFLLMLSVSSSTSATVNDHFLQCMSIHSTPHAKSAQIIHQPNSSLYSYFLQSSQQNPRWLNASTSKPLLILTPFHESEIQAAILCSRKQGLQIRTRSGGHDYEGLSYLSEAPFIIYGLAADNILDAYLIDVNGRILNRESMGESLFWAIRGGGGASFGILVSWKIKLVRVPPTVTMTIQASFNSLFLGGVDKLIPLMGKSFPELGLQAGDCTEMTWIESVLYFAGFPRGNSLDVLLNRTHPDRSYFKAKSDYVKEPIPEVGLEGVWERFLKEQIVFMIMDPYGGRMNKISESELPFPHRKGNLYNIQYLVKWEVNEAKISNKHVHWIRMLFQYMRPFVSKSPRAAYLNYRDLDLGINNQDNASYSQAWVWGTKYFKGNFFRLAWVKAKVDPDNFFRNEQSIPPLPHMENKKKVV
ncbi:unnamed protein product, partial [Vitis vinifera]